MKNFIEVTKCDGNDERLLINVNNILCITPITKSDENIIAEMTNSDGMQELFDLIGNTFKEKVANIQKEIQSANAVIQLNGFDKEHSKVFYVKETYTEIKNMIKDSLV